jgi:autotransporter-associated beta strand protein
LSGSGSIATSSMVAIATGGTFDISLTTAGASITTLADFGANPSGTVSLGSQTLTITGGSTTFSGVIADGGLGGGSGGGLMVSGGTQTLAGTNTYTGATTINAGGTLALSGSGSIAKSSGVAIATGGTFDISQTTSGAKITTLNDAILGQTGSVALGGNMLTITNAFTTFSGSIGDGGLGGGLTIAGGTQTLAGVSTYTGTTTVGTGAALGLGGGGSIATSSLTTVNNNGVLFGVGTVGNTQINSGGVLLPGTGSLAAGSSSTPTIAQTLTVNGSLALQSASIYLVTINGSNYTTTKVTGTATIQSGATLQLSAANVVLNNPYTLLSAQSVTGSTFNAATLFSSPTGPLQASLAYNGTSVTETFKHAQLSLNGLPSGFTSYVNAINTLSSQGKLPSALWGLFGVPQGSILGAAGQTSGQSSTGGVPTLANMQSSFSTTLLNPNIGARGGATGAYGPALGFAPEIPNTPEEQAAYDAVAPRSPLDALMKSLDQGYTHSVWASVYGGYASVTGAANIGSPTAITRGGGIASGIDYRFGRDTVVGFGLGGGQTAWSLSSGLGSGTSDIFQAGIYGSQRLGNAYVSGSLAYALDVMNTNRTDAVSSTNLTAKFNANGITGRVESGYRFGTPDLGITPYLAGQFSALETPAYSETATSGSSAVALSYQSQVTTDIRGEAGVWGDKAFRLQDDSTLWLRGRVGYAHDWWNNNFLSANFLSLPTSSFTMAGVTPPANLALASVMTEIRNRNGLTFGVKFDGEFSSGAYSLAATATLRYSW